MTEIRISPDDWQKSAKYNRGRSRPYRKAAHAFVALYPPGKQQTTSEDPSAYLPAAVVNNGRFALPALNKFLKKTPNIRHKRAGARRLLIHSGDWMRYWAEEDRKKAAALGDDGIAEAINDVETRKLQEQERKRRKR